MIISRVTICDYNHRFDSIRDYGLQWWPLNEVAIATPHFNKKIKFRMNAARFGHKNSIRVNLK